MSTEQRAAIARLRFQFRVSRSDILKCAGENDVHDEKSFMAFYESVMKGEVKIERKL